jgi:hypothetical protein
LIEARKLRASSWAAAEIEKPSTIGATFAGRSASGDVRLAAEGFFCAHVERAIGVRQMLLQAFAKGLRAANAHGAGSTSIAATAWIAANACWLWRLFFGGGVSLALGFSPKAAGGLRSEPERR